MEPMTAEQAAEAAKGLTFEMVWAALMESRQRMEESQKRTDEQIAESQKRTDEQIQESQKRTDEALQRLEKTVAEVSRQFGGIGNSIGDLAESMFAGALCEKFAEYGILVTEQTERKRFREGKRVVAEADVFLENGEYAIPMEIKTKLTVKDIDGHIERIEAIRRHLDGKGDSRKLLGAVAGGVVPKNVMKLAHEKGLFVLVQSGDSVTIADAPIGFRAREW